MLAKRGVVVVDDKEGMAKTPAMIVNQAGSETGAVDSGGNPLKIVQSFRSDMLISFFHGVAN